MEFNIWKYKFSVSRQKESRIPPDKVLFDRLHLNGLLRPYFDNKASNIGILLSQISILVTIGYTMLVSDIGSKWGIDENVWIFLSLTFFGALLVWFSYIIYKILKTPSFEDFLQKLIDQSQTKEDRRFAFLLLAKDTESSLRILVEYSNTWKCWLLPNFGKRASSDIQTNDELCNALATKWAAKGSDIKLSTLKDDLISTKLSLKNGKLTTYYFDIFFVEISDSLAKKMNDREFILPAGKYAWMTIHDLRNHQYTLERNGDVIDHLEQQFAYGSPGVSMKPAVELKQ
ncbi:hypothetical protein OI450_03020 [Pectobacterium cacticida]|uniref:SMODS-associating 2TM beta-strand rich effector domain-containing protein n=1 Tax=Pectobacterium cacticida TaxID=69221 RepID=A0ABZ2G8T8_9GAMM|nr:hypothetical protein [Pectobacterium cacticida]UYX07404.1 hypothetical protein OI450_03020 [Pectobacterium cacticida]